MSPAPLSDEERLCWHILAQSENVGPATFQNLLAKFGTASAALEALPELSRRGGLRRPLKIYDAAKARADFERAASCGAFYIASSETDYPELLRQSPAPPPLICVKGQRALLARPALSMVGARNASAIGLRFARAMAAELASAGFVIVSGLARGIDTAAHEASLKSGTIAVVAGGIDHIYPPENAKLHQAIGEDGLLMAEMPPGTAPKAEYFPRRNRVIAGLSTATLIMEAALRSGSLTTARFANEAGRDVFAVPGSPLDPRCEGTNGLIKDGAHMLTRAADVLNEIGAAQIPGAFAEPVQFDLRPAEGLRGQLMQLLTSAPIDVDTLVRETHAAPQAVMGIIMELELAGEVDRHAGGQVSRRV